MEINKFNNYYSTRSVIQLVEELNLYRYDDTKKDWYLALITHLKQRQMSLDERQFVDIIINSHEEKSKKDTPTLEYEIACHNTLKDLKALVNSLIFDGWIPQGGVSVASEKSDWSYSDGTRETLVIYYQPLVRNKKENKDKINDNEIEWA